MDSRFFYLSPDDLKFLSDREALGQGIAQGERGAVQGGVRLPTPQEIMQQHSVLGSAAVLSPLLWLLHGRSKMETDLYRDKDSSLRLYMQPDFSDGKPNISGAGITYRRKF